MIQDETTHQISVVMPCFNESQVLEKVVRDWGNHLLKLELSYEIIIINDGSTDGSGRILDSLRREFRKLRVVHQLRSGQGKAVKRGLEMARGEWVLVTNSNGRYEPADFDRLWQKRNEADLILGNRIHRIQGILGSMRSALLNRRFEKIFGSRLEDPNSPFRLMLRSKLLPLSKAIPPSVDAVNMALAGNLLLTQGRVIEVPIPYRQNEMRAPKTISDSLLQVLGTASELRAARRFLTRHLSTATA